MAKKNTAEYGYDHDVNDRSVHEILSDPTTAGRPIHSTMMTSKGSITWRPDGRG